MVSISNPARRDWKCSHSLFSTTPVSFRIEFVAGILQQIFVWNHFSLIYLFKKRSTKTFVNSMPFFNNNNNNKSRFLHAVEIATLPIKDLIREKRGSPWKWSLLWNASNHSCFRVLSPHRWIQNGVRYFTMFHSAEFDYNWFLLDH